MRVKVLLRLGDEDGGKEACDDSLFLCFGFWTYIFRPRLLLGVGVRC